MNFSVKIKAGAANTLRRIPGKERIRLIDAIDRLAETPFAGGVLKGEFSGLRRIRVGSYRIVYEVVESQLMILAVRVSRRKDAYR